ncbi:hypothetical protein B0H19DRAFT_1370000 [Mycena capillaripes]|nr:hypothetical protein B0H19DRAFT_1370000 [Mycena capillaripes]
MPIIPDTPVSIVASELPNNLSIFLGINAVAATAVIVHYASPKRLTAILIVAMAELKKTYVKALDTGHISASETERFNVLKHRVSAIKKETLVDSRSYMKSICGFLKGRTLTVLLCIWEVEDLETQIKILYAGLSRIPSLLLHSSNSSKNNPHKKTIMAPESTAALRPAYREEPYSRQPPSPSNNPSPNTPFMPSRPQAALYPSPPPGPPGLVPPQGGPYSEPSPMYAPMGALRQPGPPPMPRDHRECEQRDRDREQRERDRERQRERGCDRDSLEFAQPPRTPHSSGRRSPLRRSPSPIPPFIETWRAGRPIQTLTLSSPSPSQLPCIAS